MGKSSTANSLFKERVAKPSVFQEGEPKAAAVSRKAADFVLTVVDTPSLQDAEVVSQGVRRLRFRVRVWAQAWARFRLELVVRHMVKVRVRSRVRV